MLSEKSKEELIDKVGFKKHFKAKSWEEYNQMFFDGLAPKYDFLNQILSCGFHDRSKKRAVKNVPIKPHMKILDLCTGSGDIAILLAQDNPSCQVIGVDVSQNMLKIARKKASHLTNVEFRTADVLDLPFKEGEFDVTFISFGLRNLKDIVQGIVEMRRVTKINGTVVNLDLGKPDGWLLKGIYALYFETIIPFLGKTIFHRHEFNSFRYLPESNKYFPAPKELIKIFETNGFTDVKSYKFMLGGINQQVAV